MGFLAGNGERAPHVLLSQVAQVANRPIVTRHSSGSRKRRRRFVTVVLPPAWTEQRHARSGLESEVEACEHGWLGGGHSGR